MMDKRSDKRRSRRSQTANCRRCRRSLFSRLSSLVLISTLSVFFTVLGAQALVLDSFMENFDSRTAGASINGVEFWEVSAGSASNALIQTTVTPDGSGKALQISGAEDLITLNRTTSYGGLTPTWVRFLIRPGVGGERREAPTTGIAAVSFDYNGAILAADGPTWVETGKTYEPEEWWEVIYKLNFSSHTYDLYLKPTATLSSDFTPAKSGLHFIDSSISTLQSFTIEGAYSAVADDDTFIDDLTVTYIERIEIITAAQTLIQDEASEAITLQLQSSSGEPQNAPWDLTLELNTSSSDGEFSLKAEPWQEISQVVLTKDRSSVTFYYKDAKVGKPTLVASEFPDQGWDDALQLQNVIEAFDHFEVTAFSPQIAGAAFNIAISARDGQDNVNTSYDGTVELAAQYVSPSGGSMTLTPIEATGFVDGVLNVSVTYPDAGIITILATDSEDSEIQGTSGQIAMTPQRLELEAAGSQTVAASFPLTVRAVNASDSVTPNYQGTVTLGLQAISPASGAGALSPTSIGASSFNNGIASVQMTYPSWGSIAIAGTDASASGITGQTGTLTFHPKSLKLEISAPPAPRTFFYTQEPFEVKLSVLSAQDTAIGNYQGTVQIAAQEPLGLGQTYAFGASEAGVHTFNLSPSTAGTYTVQLTDSASAIASESKEVEVQQAYLEVLSTTGAVGSGAEVPIILVDANGKIITGENQITVSVRLIESNANGSSSTTNQRVTLTNGRATLMIFNSEEESVTVIPTSPFGIQPKSGTVTFGRFSTKGVGFLLWREIRETPPPKSR